MQLDYELYRKKVDACFVGKSVGGTLGMPFEGPQTVHDISFYTPVPTEMLPNDDLDLQVTFLEILMREGLPVSRHKLGDLWNLYNSESLPDEYCVADANYKKMIYAPLSGTYNNKFHSGMGGVIRTEIWACLAPGDPDLAVKMAVEDAVVDHYGDGVSAVKFLAAIESAAFVENDIRKLIDIGMSYLPKGEKLHCAFTDTIKWWDETHDIFESRLRVLEKYYAENWTDVTINIAFVLLALLSCENDFSKAICNAVNLGHDADCTGATAGSILGIINPDGIEERWIKPIGNTLVLSDNMTNMTSSCTVDDFCDEIAFCCEKVQDYYGSSVRLCNVPADRKQYVMAQPWHSAPVDVPYVENEAVVTETPLVVRAIYPDTVAYVPGEKNEFKVHLINPTDTVMEGTFTVGTSQNVICVPNNFSYRLEPHEEGLYSFEVKKLYHNVRVNVNQVVLAFVTNGMAWSCRFGFPDARVYHVENLDTGDCYDVNVPGSFFTVPAGRYRYTLNFKMGALREIRISHNGKARMVVSLNGEKLIERDETMRYVPALHRGCCTKITPKRGKNALTIDFDNECPREAYIDFGTVADCGEMLVDVECV